MRFPQIRHVAFVFCVGILPSAVLCTAQIMKDSKFTPKIDYALKRTQDANVHEPSPSGVTASSQRLDRLIEEKNYPEFERELKASRLSANDRPYFEGILADRLNQSLSAIALLETVLPDLAKSNRKRAAVALDALAEDDFMLGRYSEATTRYAELLRHFGEFLDPAERRTVQDNHDSIALLGNAAPQSVSGDRSFQVSTRQDPLGLLNIPLTIGADTEWWIFDTGANISTITRSTAKRLSLTVSKGRAQTQGGATGAEVSLSTAIIPEITFGRAVIRNVAVLVMDDKDLSIDLGFRKSYQINGILGYPVLAAMQSFTISGSRMQIGSPSAPSARTARLYVDELTPLIAGSVGGMSLIFQFDTGSAGADLTARFLKEFPQWFASMKREQGRFGGAGGTRTTATYHLPELKLNFGSATATLKNVPLYAGNRGELLDKLYGNLGQGLLKQFRSYTIDFTRMQIVLGNPANE